MRRNAAVLLITISLVGVACTNQREGAGGGGRRPDGLRLVANLESFEACDDLLEYLRDQGTKMVGPWGFDGGHVLTDRQFSATPLATTGGDGGVRATAEALASDAAGGAESGGAAAPPAFSGTNVQEAGVDEPDIVKTDGRRLVTMAGGDLRIVDLTGDAPRAIGSLTVNAHGDGVQLFLAGDRVLVMRQEDPQPVATMPENAAGDRAVAPSPHRPQPLRTRVTVVDIADGAKPRVVSDLTLDGSLVSSRLVDGVARLVLRTGPPLLAFTTPTSEADAEQAKQANRKLVEQTGIDDWLAGYSYEEPGNPGAAAKGRLTDCREVRRPQQPSGLDMVTVVSVDPADARPGAGATVVGAGETVYASATSLYVTSAPPISFADDTPIPMPQPEVGAPVAPPAVASSPIARDPRPSSTDVHKFDISDDVTTRYAGSGRVDGYVLNQFSISEFDGHLRVATTTPEQAESRVSVLAERDGALEVVGQVGGLGKDERIYAVRFLGDRGYVVTFRQTDPLYVIDLADPRRPAVRGELKIPGYSAYLHPLGDHRLLGVGQDATDQGRTVGTQISLFDVSDPANPRRLANTVLPQAHSEAEFDHHAFLYWAATGLAVMPIQSFGGFAGGRESAPPVQEFVGAIGFRVTENEVAEAARLRHRDGVPIRRAIVVGDRLLTLSERGLLASDLATLAERSWLALL